MKKLFTLIMVIFLTFSAFSQSPEKMSYQCVVRNAGGALLTNQSVALRISILQGTTSGTVVYSETYNPNPQTNANGLLTIEIGGGVPVTGSLSDIDWASGPYFLKTETDPAGGTNYSIVGTSQLLSVPYALYARTAENGSVWSKSDPDIYFNAGKVGIGTSNPSTYIHGHGSPIASRGQLSLSSPAGQDIFLSFYEAGTFKSYLWFNVANQDLRLQNFTAGNLDLNPYGGKVGIGTLSPTTALDVNGIITATGGTFSNDLLVNGITVGKGKGYNSYSTVLGFNALASSSGTYCTAIGFSALSLNTSSDNTAIGASALSAHQTGGGNTAIGAVALAAHQTGSDNTAIGNGTLQSSLTGNYNTAIGHWTLTSNNGYSNTAIGIYAGLNNTTGNSNVFLGSSAGFYETGSNKLFVDNQQRASESDARIKSLIYGVFDANPANQILAINGNVGIGTMTPNYKLDVRGTIGNNTTLYHSDIRWKTDVRPLKYGIKELVELNCIRYLWNANDYPEMGFDEGLQFGFIAQEFEKVIPELVKTDKDGYKSIDYVKLTPVLVEAIKEQQKQIESAEQENQQIKSELEELKTLVITLIANQTAQDNK